MVVGARQAGLSIAETADLLGFSRITISRVYRERSEKEKISSSLGENASLMPEVRGEWSDWFKMIERQQKATVTQITTRYNQGMQKTISERTTR
ncbi:hypothetical protein LDENG_00178000 [Lucifuga dentata]|nr:hypothetical protein LDENG_00178000 [Lucifuga dentata]